MYRGAGRARWRPAPGRPAAARLRRASRAAAARRLARAWKNAARAREVAPHRRRGRAPGRRLRGPAATAGKTRALLSGGAEHVEERTALSRQASFEPRRAVA